MTTTTTPLQAALLSALCPGLGQLRCGRRGRGLLLFALSLLFAPCTAAAMRLDLPDELALTVVLASTASFALVSLVAVLDAVSLARRLRPGAGAPLRGGVLAAGVTLGLLYPAATAGLLRDDVVRAYLIPTSSMAPTLVPGDRLLADPSAERLARLERGDLVVFTRPDAPDTHLVKRLVALPGDRVAVRDGDLVVDGDEVPTAPAREDQGLDLVWEAVGDVPYRRVVQRAGAGLPDLDELVVPPGACVVLGDHRPNSVDSRSFGLVRLEDIEAVARFLFVSGSDWDRVGALAGPRPPKDIEKLLAIQLKRRKAERLEREHEVREAKEQELRRRKR